MKIEAYPPASQAQIKYIRNLLEFLDGQIAGTYADKEIGPFDARQAACKIGQLKSTAEKRRKHAT